MRNKRGEQIGDCAGDHGTAGDGGESGSGKGGTRVHAPVRSRRVHLIDHHRAKAVALIIDQSQGGMAWTIHDFMPCDARTGAAA